MCPCAARHGGKHLDLAETATAWTLCDCDWHCQAVKDLGRYPGDPEAIAALAKARDFGGVGLRDCVTFLCFPAGGPG